MNPTAAALRIWNSSVDAVRAEGLIERHVEYSDRLRICGESRDVPAGGRLCVVGAGKAAGYLAVALENQLRHVAPDLGLHGFVNVPANCVVPTDFIQLHAARPAGVNEPRAEGVAGTQQILQMVASLQPDDLCICLLTGGGSALLPAPRSGVTLDDKLNVTRFMSSRGASIQELNRVRIALSDVKGGGLSRACKAAQLDTLIISDIIGDPLDLIASGPTIPAVASEESPSETLLRFVERAELPASIWQVLATPRTSEPPTCRVTNQMLANNGTAVSAAAAEANRMGLATEIIPSESPNATAEEVGAALLQRAATADTGTCLIWGGEPVVHLADNEARGRGGRNQQLVLTASSHWHQLPEAMRDRICILSGGTDGEDGPTDAAGAFVDRDVIASLQNHNFDVDDHLKRNDAYPLFEATGGLIKTGPTHTNVCDVRVAVIL